ncbi:MAG: hypothetical protein SH850_02040 [Planctomycetaceae bacterium]|nr:hypothetical protein [Planctomycetaceae bacterium]
MTWSDPIVDEVRRTREAYAARFNYDLRAIFRDLKEREQDGGRQIVSYAEEDLQVAPDDISLHGSVLRFDCPTDPVAEGDWDAPR